MTILVIAPHMDDEVLGCGASIARSVAEGRRVEVCIVANRAYGHRLDEKRLQQDRDCDRKAQEILGYQEMHFLNLPDELLDTKLQECIIALEEVVERVRPEVVWTPFCGDNNQDHRAVARAVQVLLRPATTPFVRRWLQYETPSSTEQAPPFPDPAFRPNVFVDASQWIGTKTRALACYDGELRPYPHPRSEQGLAAWGMMRGMASGMECAEAFMLAREKA